ncbi:MAG: hypothetical protein AAFV53_24890 [Myxococcota bacterium]
MAGVEIAETLLQWAPPLRRVRYARCGAAGDFPLPRQILEETWSDPEIYLGRLTYRRITRALDEGGEPRIVEDALIGYGPDGLTDLGVFEDGKLSLFEPAQVVLPPEVVVGATWTDEHTRSGRTSTRTVELLASNEFGNGIVSVAEVKRADGLLILRTHFIEGDGYFGYEALVQAPERPTVRTWTEAVSVTTRVD